jgi:hypothetical protein
MTKLCWTCRHCLAVDDSNNYVCNMEALSGRKYIVDDTSDKSDDDKACEKWRQT